MEDNKMLQTDVNDQKLRINTYGGMIPFMDDKPNIITVQCAKITNLDNEVCGGMIHTIDKVLTPPIGNAIETIQLETRHTTWLELIKIAGMEEELSQMDPMTMLAPTNGAFENMQQEQKDEIFADQEIAAKVVKHHILKEALCCSGITR